MAGVIDTLLALGFGALSMTRERAKEIVDELVKQEGRGQAGGIQGPD